MNPFRVPDAEIQHRIKNLQSGMQREDIHGVLIFQRVDLFYFSGTAQNGCLYVPADGKPLLMIKKFFPRAQQESGIETIVEIKSVQEIPGFILDLYGRFLENIGFELDVLPVKLFEFYKNLFPFRQYVDVSPLVLSLRRIKSSWEIRQLENTAEMSRKTFEHMETIIAPGLTEMAFAGKFEAFARTLGHGAMLRDRGFQGDGAYPWHVLSGESGGMPGVLDAAASGQGMSAAFPCGAGNKRLNRNEPIMVDFGSVLNGYHLDETRMFAIGSMPDSALAASRAAIEIHHVLGEAIMPGVATDALFRTSVQAAESLGFKAGYLGPEGYKVRFVGHGIGLELVEPFIIAEGKTDCLEPGMTVAIEPKIVFRDRFAAGIESVFLVTDAGSRLISKVPVDVFIC